MFQYPVKQIILSIGLVQRPGFPAPAHHGAVVAVGSSLALLVGRPFPSLSRFMPGAAEQGGAEARFMQYAECCWCAEKYPRSLRSCETKSRPGVFVTLLVGPRESPPLP